MNKEEQAAIIYLALSNLMQNCIEVLESSQELTPENIEFYQHLLDSATAILPEIEKELVKDSPINRPQW